MRIVGIKDVGKDWIYRGFGDEVKFDYYIDYEVIDSDGRRHIARVGFIKRHRFGRDRVCAVVWIDNVLTVEFVGADDFEKTGEVLSVIKIGGRECRYPDESIPERYIMFNVVGLPCRVTGPNVHRAWAVVTNVGNHETMIALAGLRRLERELGES